MIDDIDPFPIVEDAESDQSLTYSEKSKLKKILNTLKGSTYE